MTPKFSVRELDMIARVRRGMQVQQIAKEYNIHPPNVSATLRRIYLKLGIKSALDQLRDYPFPDSEKPAVVVTNVKRTTTKAIDSKELIIKIRHRDGDGCFFCGNPVDFSAGSKYLEHGPSMHIIRPGLNKHQPIPDDNRKICHRSCNPQVKVKDRRDSRRQTSRKPNEDKAMNEVFLVTL